MEEMLYSPKDLAEIIIQNGMSIRDSYEFIHQVWEKEKAYLEHSYQENQSKLILEVMKYCNILHDEEGFTEEAKNISQYHNVLDEIDYRILDTFFKEIRLKICILGPHKYVKRKLRTVLSEYGYQRRSKRLNEYLKMCLYFYHIETYLRDKERCDIEEVGLDDMIIFRVIG